MSGGYLKPLRIRQHNIIKKRSSANLRAKDVYAPTRKKYFNTKFQSQVNLAFVLIIIIVTDSREFVVNANE